MAAADKTKIYGDDDPALTYRSPPARSSPGDAFTGSLAGLRAPVSASYAITQGTLSAGANYDADRGPGAR